MKTTRLLSIMLLAITFLISTNSFAQKTYSKKAQTYSKWSISPVGGIIFPIGQLGESLKPGATVGLDIATRINKEVGIFAKIGYYFMTSKTTGAPIGKYLEYIAGPRYYFTKPNLKSTFFMEAGGGGYTFTQDSYIDPSDTTSAVINELSNTNPGFNAGVGVNLNLSKSVDIIMKTKYNVVFTTGGSSSFITALAGLEFKF